MIHSPRTRLDRQLRVVPAPAPALVRLMVLSLATSCAGSPAPLPDDSTFLAVGADPVVVIDEATSRLATHGFSPTSRIDAPRFSAASFTAADARTAVRVATHRGLALALDASAGDDTAALSLDPRTGTDLDGDGNADLVIVRTEPERACLALAIVDAEGVFRPVATDPRGLDPRGCIERLLDLDHDARVEAIVRARATDLGAPPPSIAEPLTLRDDGAFARASWPEGFARDELARRDAALDVAVERGDPAETVRLAIELAWIVRARGGDVAAVDEHLALASRVPLPPELIDRLADARQFLLAAVPSPPGESSSASASASE